MEHYPGCIHLIQRRKKGLGSQRGSALYQGMIWGLENTRHEIFVEMDGDLSHRVEELPTGIALVRDNTCDVAIASKYSPGSKVLHRPLGRRLLSRVASFAVGFIIDSKVDDYSNGYRFYSRKAADILRQHLITYGSPIYLTEALAIWLRNKMLIQEFPSTYMGQNEKFYKLCFIDFAKALLGILEVGVRYHFTGFRRIGDPIHARAALAALRSPFENRLVDLFSLFVFLLVGCLFFHPIPEHIDTLGLYNPVYMYTHYGKMTYPVHGYPDFMVVHPPVHYLGIALLMKAGLNSFYAQVLPLFLLFLLNILLIRSGRFGAHIKIGLLFGLYAGVFFERFLCFTIRPDACLALAWFAGLVALESGRLERWNTRKLFLGSFLITYASGLHYVASFAFFGIAVYVVWMFRDLGVRAAMTKVWAMVFGACLFGLPYLLLFIIPEWNNILTLIRSVQGNGGVMDAIQRHFRVYSWYSLNTSTICFLITPLLKARIPLVVLSTIFLALPRSTRGIAMASLPHLLFVLLYSQGKSEGYFIPEYILYFAGLAVVILIALKIVTWKKLPPLFANYVFLCSIVVFTWLLFKTHNDFFLKGDINFRPRTHEMHLARACAREIVGPDALVGSRIGPWYTSGGIHWYRVTPDIIWPKDLSGIDLKEYFSIFDAIADQKHFSNLTYNYRKATISSWYVDGTLSLKGFYITSTNDPQLCTYLFSAEKDKPLVGYGRQSEGTLYRFEERENGSFVFVSLIVPVSATYWDIYNDSYFSGILYLPDPEGTNQVGTELKSFLLFAVLPYDVYITARDKLDAGIKIRDEIRGTILPAYEQVLLQKLKQEDHPIKFYTNIQELPLETAEHSRRFPEFRKKIKRLLARACTREILGMNAVVGGRSGLEYISGGTHWYDVSSDLLWAEDLSGIDLKEYFSCFDAIADYPHMSNYSRNDRHATISSWYAEGMLSLRGFFFTSNAGSNFNIHFFTAEKAGPVAGYGYRSDGQLFRFNEEENGSFVFVSLMVPVSSTYQEISGKSVFFDLLYLPNPEGPIEQVGKDVKTFLLNAVLPYDDYLAERSELDPNIRVRDEIRGIITQVGIDTILKKLEQEDREVKSYSRIEDLPARLRVKDTNE